MKKNIYMVLLSAALLAGFICPSLTAAAEDTDDRVYKLGEVVVSAKGTGVEAIGTVREITAGEIEISGAETLDDALRLLPGIMVRTGGQGVPRPDLRGMKPRHVMLLIDGIPFNSAGDGQFDPRLITTENIAKIKISYGNDSVLYGPGGLGGVINVITKKGSEKTEIDLSGKYSEKDSLLAKANVSGGKGSLNYFFSASDYNSDGYKLSDDFDITAGIKDEDGGVRNNSDEKLRNFFGNIMVTPGDKSSFGLIINHIEGEYGVPPITKDDSDPFGKKLKYERVDSRSGLSLNLSGSYDIDGPLSFRVWAFMNDLEEIKNGYDNNKYAAQVKNGSYTLKETTAIRGASVQSQYNLNDYGRISLTLGTKEEGFDFYGWKIKSNARNPIDLEFHETATRNIAAEYEVEPSDKVGLVFGYGYSWFKKEDSASDNTDNYLVGINYDLSESSRIKGSVSDKVRFPSVTQLYGESESNPDLTYEKSMNYELGFEHRVSQCPTVLSFTLFRRDVENYISKDSFGTNRNNEEYMFQGIEITAKNQSYENLDLMLAYTFMDTEDKSAGSAIDDVQYNPRHKTAIEGVYNFAYEMSLYASVEHVATQYCYSNDGNNTKAELPDYTLLNLKIEKKLMSGALKIFAGADNLLDENYYESYALPQEGRSLFCGFKYSVR